VRAACQRFAGRVGSGIAQTDGSGAPHRWRSAHRPARLAARPAHRTHAAGRNRDRCRVIRLLKPCLLAEVPPGAPASDCGYLTTCAQDSLVAWGPCTETCECFATAPDFPYLLFFAHRLADLRGPDQTGTAGRGTARIFRGLWDPAPIPGGLGAGSRLTTPPNGNGLSVEDSRGGPKQRL